MKRGFFWLLTGLLMACIAAAWVALWGFGTILPLPLGMCPMLVLAGSMSNVGAAILCALVVLGVYVWLFCSIRGVSRRRRYGTVGVLIILTLDMAANVIATALSWWYLLAVALDIAVLALADLLYRRAGQV